MQTFKDNPYPQIMFRADADPKHVHNKKEREEALADGWSDTYVKRSYPRWVGPHDEQIPDSTGQVTIRSRGGAIAHDAKEENALRKKLGIDKAA